MSRPKSDTATKISAREHILSTAGTLFYQRGYHAVGVDTIVAESGVAKMTLYRHFPSKDDLIVAYLQQANADFWGWWEQAIAPYDDPRRQLIGLFEATAELSTLPMCFGCAFQMTAGEFPEPTHPGHQVALEHKQAVITRLVAMAEAAGADDATALGHQLFLVMDGVWAARRMFGADSPAQYAVSAARTLVGG